MVELDSIPLDYTHNKHTVQHRTLLVTVKSKKLIKTKII
jgi:hypothetical protein